MKLFVFLILFLNSLCGFPRGLTVGVITGVPPFSEMSDSGAQTSFYGFSIDIMNNICVQLNRECIFSPLTLDTQFAALEEGKVDVLLLPIPYQFSRLSNYAVSLPYMVSRVQFVADKNSPIQKGAPIKNYKIGVMKTTFYDLLNKSPYKKDNTIVPFDNVPDLISSLMDHKVDLIVLNSAIAYYFVTNNTYGIKSVSKEMSLGDGYGIIALPENNALIKDINKAILTMQANGSYLSIYNKYYDGQSLLRK